MAHPGNSFLHSPPQSLHTQESGEAGLSSYMKHQFNDHCNKSALAEPERGSSVIPILKENLDICDGPARLWDAAGPKPGPEAAEGGFTQPSAGAVVHTNYFPPVFATTAIAEVHVEEEGSCSKMAPSPKCPPLAAGGGRRKSKRCRKKAAGKYRELLPFCMMTFRIILLSEGLPAGANPVADQEPKCFTCKDKDRCSNLMKIFDTVEDTPLYQRGLNETFPECSGVSAPLNKRCAVCGDQYGIVILCSKDVGPTIDVEDTEQIDVVHAACVHQKSAVGISVQCPTKRYVVILFQPVTLTCNYQTTATQPPVVTWKYKSYCRDPIQAALNPSSADSILSQNNPNFDANIDCADSQRTVRIVASKQGNAVTLGQDYQGRKISILNNADLNLAQTAWGDSGVYVCSVISSQDLSGNGEDFTELIVLDWLLVVLVVLGFLLLLLLIGICWCQCCPHTCCCYVSCPCCPERCCCPRALYEAGKAAKKIGGPMSQYAPTLYAPSMYAQPAYGGPPSHHPGMPMLPMPNGAGPPHPHNGYGVDYDGASSVGQGSQVPLLRGQDGGADPTRSGYRIQVDPDGNATRAIYYMERELANMDPSRPGNNRLDNMTEVSSLHEGGDPRGRGGRSQPPPLATVYDRDEAMSTISSVSQQGQRHGGGGGYYPEDRARARSMDNLDDLGRRYDPPSNRRPEEFRGRRGSDDGWSSSARSGNGRDFDDRRRRDPSPDHSRRGDDGRYGGMQGRRSRSRDDLMELARERERGGARGRRDDGDYDDGLLREAMERKRMGEQQRARSRERLDSESDRSDRGRAPRGPPPLPQAPPSGHPGRRDDYPPPPPPPYSDDESMSSAKRSNLRKNGAVSRESLVV
ncbi:lipolysis-stimulated lipoprotein receptor isoform X2 [Pungitius pungitius]|uniref:lipolysis-stimulated lipoprotein receptor isoform X2 n=1 Tax=Pungitius pungitius TaxID=134920 RepID=UPI002E1319D8